jgi:hypothetical protein
MFLVGDHVQITPKTKEAKAFWGFVDGWIGTVQGYNLGNVEVVCRRDDGIKTFYVPDDCLSKPAR